MESRSEACFFVCYPKGTRGGFFYSPKADKVFVSTNVVFFWKRLYEKLQVEKRKSY